MQNIKSKPTMRSSSLKTARTKLNEERRKALILKKAVLQQMLKEQQDIYDSWVRRGR